MAGQIEIKKNKDEEASETDEKEETVEVTKIEIKQEQEVTEDDTGNAVEVEKKEAIEIKKEKGVEDEGVEVKMEQEAIEVNEEKTDLCVVKNEQDLTLDTFEEETKPHIHAPKQILQGRVSKRKGKFSSSADDSKATARPLADKKLNGQLINLLLQSVKHKQVAKGAREVVKRLHEGIAEIVLLAADTVPLDMLMHIPPLCEEKNVPYVFMQSQMQLGRACGISRGVIACAVTEKDDRLDPEIQRFRQMIRILWSETFKDKSGVFDKEVVVETGML